MMLRGRISLGPPLTPGVCVIAQLHAGDSSKRTINPSARRWIHSVVIKEIQKLWDRRNPLLTSEHARFCQIAGRTLANAARPIVREAVQQSVNGFFGSEHREPFNRPVASFFIAVVDVGR